MNPPMAPSKLELLRRRFSHSLAARKEYWRAIAGGDLNAIKRGIQCGLLNVNLVGEHGCTPLHVAVLKQHDDIVRELIASGANVDSKMADGATPLMMSAQTDKDSLAKRNCVKHLLAAKADPNSEVDGSTLLCFAAQRGSMPLVTQLLHAKADPNLGVHGVLVPLFHAAQFGYINIAKTLVHHGARISHPLCLARVARRKMHHETADWLLKVQGDRFFKRRLMTVWKDGFVLRRLAQKRAIALRIQATTRVQAIVRGYQHRRRAQRMAKEVSFERIFKPVAVVHELVQIKHQLSMAREKITLLEENVQSLESRPNEPYKEKYLYAKAMVKTSEQTIELKDKQNNDLRSQLNQFDPTSLEELQSTVSNLERTHRILNGTLRERDDENQRLKETLARERDPAYWTSPKLLVKVSNVFTILNKPTLKRFLKQLPCTVLRGVPSDWWSVLQDTVPLAWAKHERERKKRNIATQFKSYAAKMVGGLCGDKTAQSAYHFLKTVRNMVQHWAEGDVEEDLHASLQNQFGDFFIPLIRHLRPHVHCLA